MTGEPASWKPGSTLAAAAERARLLAVLRTFFAAHDVLEVDTPALSRSAVTDPQIESVAVKLAVDSRHDYYLHTSPEYAMKRLLAAGWPDIYQVCKVFRDGECGPRHQPEFTMIEWYRRDLSLREMMMHTTDLLQQLLSGNVQQGDPHYLGYAEAFSRFTGIDPLSADTRDIIAACDPDDALLASLGTDRDAWLDLLLTTRVAPAFDPQRLTVLHHYPASQAALARVCPDDNRVADRFEIFLGENELANGYRELTDAGEQQRRFDDDQRLRRERGLATRPVDHNLLHALESGLPDCCGVAVGFDRLLMLNLGCTTLSGVQSFTVL